jgi:DNA-binding NarL/FixJ family response regulator
MDPITAMSETRVVIVDDHPLFRDALSRTLATVVETITIDQAASLDELNAKMEAGAAIDLILLDLNMPGVQGFSGLMYLRAQYPHVPVVVVSATEDPKTIRRCLELKASGFIPKSQPAKAIREALKSVLDGGVWTPPGLDIGPGQPALSPAAERLAALTPQQMRVLMMLGEGLLNKQIAYKLDVSEATVKAHVSAILQKLGVDSRTQAVIAMSKLASGE